MKSTSEGIIFFSLPYSIKKYSGQEWWGEEIGFDPPKNLHGKNQSFFPKNSSPNSRSKMFNV